MSTPVLHCASRNRQHRCLSVFGYPVEQVLAPETFNSLVSKIVETPKLLLLLLILMLSAMGACAIYNNPTDVDWMLGFGVLG